MNRGVLVVLSGFSGSGKGTLISLLMKKHDNYTLSVSATTRSPRPGETEGVSYFFKTQEEFSRMIEQNELLEHAVYVDHFYGTPKDSVEELLSSGKDVILEIEMQGAMQVKRNHPDAVLIFVTPPDVKELRHRLTARNTETQDVISSRLHRAGEEAKNMGLYDYILINDILEKCADELHGIIQAQHFRTSEKKEFIRGIQEEFKSINEKEI